MLYYDTTVIILIPAMLLAMLAQARVNRTFNKYAKMRNGRGLTGAQAARRVLDANGLYDVAINPIGGNLTDNYNPRKKVLNLSQSVYGVSSVSAVSVACHEAGHAIQHSRGYVPLKIRNGIVPLVNFASRLTWPMVLIGILLIAAGNYQLSYWGNMIFNIGVIAFVAIVCFHLITLPVEFNASHRALVQMEELSLISQEDEKGAKKVLRAAAMTYVAALAVAVANLLRILAIRGRSD